MVLDPSTLSAPAWVTLAYVAVYYAFIINILRVKTAKVREYAARGEKFDRYFGQDRAMLAADRTQLNMLEHMPVFLVLLWMHAIFGDPGEAAVVGWVYTITRLAYPLLLRGHLGRGIPTRILWVTFTGYAVLLVQVIRIIMGLLG